MIGQYWFFYVCEKLSGGGAGAGIKGMSYGGLAGVRQLSPASTVKVLLIDPGSELRILSFLLKTTCLELPVTTCVSGCSEFLSGYNQLYKWCIGAPNPEF
jgi:hypothetical protein